MYINNETHILRYNNIVLKPSIYDNYKSIAICWILSLMLLMLVIACDVEFRRKLKYNRE